jgi:DNA-binding CsgD family transcriptional regulator
VSGSDSVEGALALLGVPGEAAALYSRLLLLRGAPVGVLDGTAVADLVALGLAVNADNWVTPSDPRAAVHRLVQQGQTRAARPSSPVSAPSKQVLEPHDAERALGRALAAARRVDVIDTEPYLGVERDLGGHTRWAMRIVLSPGSAPSRLDDLAGLVRSGVPVRTSETAAAKVWIVDGALVLVGDGWGFTALGDGPANRAVRALFEALWSGSEPVSGTPTTLPASERALLALIDQGLTDAEICARLAFSRRTLYRRLEHLMVRAGVGTRYQLAAEAVRRGWLR